MICYCGGVKKTHQVGDEDCKRERAIPPRKLSGQGDMWIVTETKDGKTHKSRCTGYTLRHQRGYYEHEDGQWSRPKGGGSVNSLPDET
jgi:hypothetical protein